jgi:hypothetical protein
VRTRRSGTLEITPLHCEASAAGSPSRSGTSNRASASTACVVLGECVRVVSPLLCFSLSSAAQARPSIFVFLFAPACTRARASAAAVGWTVRFRADSSPDGSQASSSPSAPAYVGAVRGGPYGRTASRVSEQSVRSLPPLFLCFLPRCSEVRVPPVRTCPDPSWWQRAAVHLFSLSRPDQVCPAC